MSPQLHKYFIDPFERTVVTFFEQFAVVLTMTSGGSLILHQSYGAAADTAGFAALITLVTSYIAVILDIKLTGWFDVGRRIVLTFLQSIGGSLAAAGVTHSVVHFGWKAALAIAINVTLTAAFKSLVSFNSPVTLGGSLAPVASKVGDVYNITNIVGSMSPQEIAALPEFDDSDPEEHTT